MGMCAARASLHVCMHARAHARMRACTRRHGPRRRMSVAQVAQQAGSRAAGTRASHTDAARYGMRRMGHRLCTYLERAHAVGLQLDCQ